MLLEKPVSEDFMIIACIGLIQYQCLTDRQTNSLTIFRQQLLSLLCWCAGKN